MLSENPVIRLARLGDAAGLARVEVETWRDAYPTLVPRAYLVHRLDGAVCARRWHGRIAGGERDILVAETAAAGRCVVGYATWGRSRFAGALPASQLYELYVSPGERDRGIGRGLCAAVAKRLIGAGLKSMVVEVLEGNPSRYFYEALGGRLVARGEAAFAGRRLPAVLYAWDDLRSLIAAPVD